MNTARKLALGSILAAAGALAFATPATAAPAAHCSSFSQQSGPNIGLLNGLSLGAPIDLGLDFSGNALGLLGMATASGADDTVTCTYQRGGNGGY